MEVNLSHKTRQEILTTQDLTHPDLFKNALNEVMQLIKMVNQHLSFALFVIKKLILLILIFYALGFFLWF